MNVWTLTACFFVYSFLGWVWEVIYFYVMERRFRSGGITSAPLLPIYGMGAIAVLAVLDLHVDNPFAVFLLSALLASAVEFAGHYFMEKVFHVRLWDYRGNKFNLQGRICLENSLGFGILAMLLVYVVHPVMLSVLGFFAELGAGAGGGGDFDIVRGRCGKFVAQHGEIAVRRRRYHGANAVRSAARTGRAPD